MILSKNSYIIGSVCVLLGLLVGLSVSYWYFQDQVKSMKDPERISLPNNTVINTQIAVPREYRMPYLSGSLNVAYQMYLGMAQAPTQDEIEEPTYPYIRGLLFDRWIKYPGRDEFISCIKDPNYVNDTKKSLLDKAWQEACSKPIPSDLVFNEADKDLLDRFRLSRFYAAFKTGSIDECKSLMNVAIRKTNSTMNSDEFRNLVVCHAAASRHYYAINAEYFRMEATIANKNCELYGDTTLRNACKFHLSTK